MSSAPGDSGAGPESIAFSHQQITRLLHLLDQQVEILRRIDERQSAADFSQQPIPEVPASSSSAWNALLGSTLRNVIMPRVERWRSGLDALLVFLGLFSAIITAFLVESVKNLSHDKTERTNELLANLTEVIVAIHSYSGDAFMPPLEFYPDAKDIRSNAFWSLSLTISLAVAAVAVGCRSFLNMATWSWHKKASDRLADIWTRWNAANRVLRPAIELLPVILIIPVFLFLVGVLDILFSSVQTLHPLPDFLLLALGISVVCVTIVAGLLVFTIVDGSIHPHSSPFQSKLSYAIHRVVVPRLERINQKLYRTFRQNRDHHRAEGTTMQVRVAETVLPSPLEKETVQLYHEMVQITHEDENLDQAAGALFNIVHDDAGFSFRERIVLSPQVCATLLHLLSPEASIRSNRTAASVIVRMQATDPLRMIIYPDIHCTSILTSLIQAATRSPGAANLAAIWDSLFVRALAVMILQTDPDTTEHPLIIQCLNAAQMSWKETLFGPSPAFKRAARVFQFLLDVLYSKLRSILPGRRDRSPADARIVDLLLSPQFAIAATPVLMAATRLMQVLVLHLPWNWRHEQTHVVRWIMKVTSTSHVVSFYLRSFAGLSESEVKSLSWTHCGNMFAIADIVANLCFEDDEFQEWDSLAELCAACLLKFIGFRERLETFTFMFDLIQTFHRVLKRTDYKNDAVFLTKLVAILEFVHRIPDSRYADILSEYTLLLTQREDIYERGLRPQASSEWYELSWSVNVNPEMEDNSIDIPLASTSHTPSKSE
ncbi:hypothetical protein MKEN_00620100 [Mycena kentingensis (nom. inval.)]|nr:hypothetical protein MKEN_00620100 [Mycena kentingensis (nom. inval.)]